MPVGHRDIPWDKSPDRSPVFQYNVKVSQRDLDEIHHLVDRNFAGLTVAWTPAAIAVIKVLQQIDDQNQEFDNYDNDGACPVCKAPEHEETD